MLHTGYCSVKHILFEKFLNFSLDQKLPNNSTRVTGYLASEHSFPLLGTKADKCLNTSFMFSLHQGKLNFTKAKGSVLFTAAREAKMFKEWMGEKKEMSFIT